MQTTHIVLIAAALAFAAGCARREETQGDAAATAATAARPAKRVEAPPPPPEVTPVRIEIGLTPKAQERLASLGEGIRAEITYAGDPANGQEDKVNQLGLVELGHDVRILPGAGTIELPLEAVDASKLSLIVGQPQLMVNVTSARKASKDNVLSCPFYWDTLSTAGHAGVRITCDIAPATK